MIRVFPSKTSFTPIDNKVRFGKPGFSDFQLDKNTPVRVSCTFSWDKPRALWLAEQWSARFKDVELGGPAFDDPGGEFEPGRYLGGGVVITSRGCPHQCDFCLVPRREGTLRELQVKDGWIVQDNNLLACSEPHLDKVFKMLSRQKHPADFRGGLEAALFRPDHLERILKIEFSALWFAADSESQLEPLRQVGKMLDEAGVSVNKRRCYVLFDPSKETTSKAARRARQVLKAGFLPFAQVRREEDVEKRRPSQEWMRLNRYWALPAIFRRRLNAIRLREKFYLRKFKIRKLPTLKEVLGDG